MTIGFDSLLDSINRSTHMPKWANDMFYIVFDEIVN